MQLPPTDIICFTVTAWQHESNVDILISCTHGCLAEQASASEPFTPYLCKSGRQGLFTAAQGEVATFSQSAGAAERCTALFFPQELITSASNGTGRLDRDVYRRVVLNIK